MFNFIQLLYTICVPSQRLRSQKSGFEHSSISNVSRNDILIKAICVFQIIQKHQFDKCDGYIQNGALIPTEALLVLSTGVCIYMRYIYVVDVSTFAQFPFKCLDDNDKLESIIGYPLYIQFEIILAHT